MSDLAALVDLEWLLRDGADSAEFEAERARAVGRRISASRGLTEAAARARIDADRDLREALALGWLDAVRIRRDDLPGRKVARGLSGAGWVCAGLGLLFGVGSAKAFLAYDGSAPVNVLPFVAFFFGLQIALLALMLWFVLRRTGGPGLLHQPIAWIAGRWFGERGQAVVDGLRATRARRGLYAGLERWTLFAIAQRTGLAFNLGALGAALSTIAFSDLVFCWSTTLELDPARVHAVARALALPWSWLPSAVPSLEAVEASQWARMPGGFVGGTSAEDALRLAARWWGFLVAGLGVYGLLPRALALWIGGRMRRRALRAAGFDHAGYQALFERMLPRPSGWQGPAAADVVGPAPAAGRGPVGPRPPEAAGAPTWVLVWGSLGRAREAVGRLIARHSGAELRGIFPVGGADLAGDARAVEALRAAAASRLRFVAAAGQQPTAEVLGLLRAVRDAVGPGRPIVVGLLDLRAGDRIEPVGEDERATWRRALGALEDPHLWVEAMEEGA